MKIRKLLIERVLPLTTVAIISLVVVDFLRPPPSSSRGRIISKENLNVDCRYAYYICDSVTNKKYKLRKEHRLKIPERGFYTIDNCKVEPSEGTYINYTKDGFLFFNSLFIRAIDPDIPYELCVH